MPIDDTARLEEACLHCKRTVDAYDAICCEEELRTKKIIRHLPLLAANDFLESD